MQGEVRLFLRMLIKKLPGSRFCLCFFLASGLGVWGCDFRKEITSYGAEGRRRLLLCRLCLGAGVGAGGQEGSDPQITSQGLVRGAEEDHFTSS